MRKHVIITLFSAAMLVLVSSWSFGYELTVENPSDHELEDYPVEVDVSELPESLQVSALRVTDEEGDLLTSQVDDLNHNGDPDKLLFLISLDANESERVEVEKSPDPYERRSYGEERSFRLWAEPNLENRWLRITLPPAYPQGPRNMWPGAEKRPYHYPPDTPMMFDPRANIDVLDRASEEKLFEFTMASVNPLVEDNVHQYAEAGRVRGMVQRTRQVHLREEPDRSFCIVDRFFIYKKSSRIDVEVLLVNTEDSEKKVPEGLRVMDGRLGDMLVKKLGNVQRRSTNGGGLKSHYAGQKPRGHFWRNPETGYYVLYSPHPGTWSDFSMPDRRWYGSMFGVDYIRFSPSMGPRVRLFGTSATLDPGQTERFRFSFLFDRGSKEKAEAKFKQLLDEASGEVNVIKENEKSNDNSTPEKQGNENASAPAAPELKWPLDGQKQVNFAVEFTVDGEGATQELQVARDQDFEEIVVRTRTEKIKNYKPEQELEKGTYYWRARGISSSGQPGSWSEIRSFTVDLTNPPERTKPLVRPVNPENPMFLVPHLGEDMYSKSPEPIQEMLVGEGGYSKGDSPSFPTFIKFGKSGKVNMSKLEHAYRSSDNIIGFLYREYGININNFREVLKLSAAYGRYVGALNIGSPLDTWLSKDYYPLMKKYGKYVLPNSKMNNRRAPLPKLLIEAGAYLSGRVDRFGTETEWGAAWKMGGWERKIKQTYGSLVRPLNYMPPFISGLAMGASGYRLEGHTMHRYMSLKHGGWDGFSPQWHRVIKPFFTDIQKHDLIPTREEMRQKINVVMKSRPRYGVKSPAQRETFFPNRTLAALHGMHIEAVPLQHVFENQWLPDQAPHYVVPVLPSYMPEEKLNQFENVLDPEEFDYPEEAVEYASQFYPEYRSEAFATLVGDSGFVFNGIDERRDPQSGPQKYHLDLTEGPVKYVKGSVNWQAYLLMKQYPDSLFIHANNHKPNYTSIKLKSRSGNRLSVDVNPEKALASENWDGSSGTLSVDLNHHSGAVRVTVEE